MSKHGSSRSLPTPQSLPSLPRIPLSKTDLGVDPGSFLEVGTEVNRCPREDYFQGLFFLAPTSHCLHLGAEGKPRRPLPEWWAKGMGGVDMCAHTHAHTLTGSPRAGHSSAAMLEASFWAFAVRDPEGFRQITSAFEKQRRNGRGRHQTRNAHNGHCNTINMGKRGKHHMPLSISHSSPQQALSKRSPETAESGVARSSRARCTC